MLTSMLASTAPSMANEVVSAAVDAAFSAAVAPTCATEEPCLEVSLVATCALTAGLPDALCIAVTSWSPAVRHRERMPCGLKLNRASKQPSQNPSPKILINLQTPGARTFSSMVICATPRLRSRPRSLEWRPREVERPRARPLRAAGSECDFPLAPMSSRLSPRGGVGMLCACLHAHDSLIRHQGSARIGCAGNTRARRRGRLMRASELKPMWCLTSLDLQRQGPAQQPATEGILAARILM